MTTITMSRDSIGRYSPAPFIRKFIPSRRQCLKAVWYQFIFLSLLMNVWLVRQQYVFRCSVGGYLMTQAKCGELAESKWDSLELARLQFMEENQDLQ
jgi:hypothetical protein